MIIESSILVRNQEWLIEKIEKINKKAIKLSLSPFKYSFSNQRLSDNKDREKYGFELGSQIIDVLLEGDNPKIDGWDLVACFEREGKVVMVNEVPGNKNNLPYNPTDIKCDHCGHKRNRKKSYLMFNKENNEFKEIGSTCLKDYFGHDPKNFLYMAKLDWLGIIEDSQNEDLEIKYSWVEKAYPLVEYLAFAKACIDKFGWVSKSKAYNDETVTPTVHHVDEQYGVRTKPQHFKHVVPIIIEDEDYTFGREAIEHFKNEIENTEYLNGYLHNVKNIIELDYVPFNHVGTAASIIGVYDSKLKKAEEERLTENKDSAWFGEKKKRYDFELTYVGFRSFETQYGESHIHSFIDADGNIFKWFSANFVSFIDTEGRFIDAENGNVVILKGTVKDHNEFNNKKETILTRCKISGINK